MDARVKGPWASFILSIAHIGSVNERAETSSAPFPPRKSGHRCWAAAARPPGLWARRGPHRVQQGSGEGQPRKVQSLSLSQSGALVAKGAAVEPGAPEWVLAE